MAGELKPLSSPSVCENGGVARAEYSLAPSLELTRFTDRWPSGWARLRDPSSAEAGPSAFPKWHYPSVTVPALWDNTEHVGVSNDLFSILDDVEVVEGRRPVGEAPNMAPRASIMGPGRTPSAPSARRDGPGSSTPATTCRLGVRTALPVHDGGSAQWSACIGPRRPWPSTALAQR